MSVVYASKSRIIKRIQRIARRMHTRQCRHRIRFKSKWREQQNRVEDFKLNIESERCSTIYKL